MSKLVALFSLLLALAGCGSTSLVDAPSRNQNGRVNYLVLHFTTENFADSLSLLTEPSANPVSAHYLIPEPGDTSYPENRLRVFKLVDENRRAWHAGLSYWGGETALNDTSIGIEIVNRSYCVENADSRNHDEDFSRPCFYPDFAPAQLSLLIELATDILRRHPEIDPVDVVGHADIAPARKVDPGPRFPWQALHRAGIGAWYDDATVLRYRQRFSTRLPNVATVQNALFTYGYEIEETGILDTQTRFVLRAFQMHFRPSGVTTNIDVDTVAVLFALLEKYRPDGLGEILTRLALDSAAKQAPKSAD